jgi:alpha-glucosidase
MLSLQREALRLRRAEPGFTAEDFAWLDSPEGVLFFSRGDGVACAVNFSAVPFALPEGSEVLLASGPLSEGQVPADTAVWVRRARPSS